MDDETSFGLHGIVMTCMIHKRLRVPTKLSSQHEERRLGCIHGGVHVAPGVKGRSGLAAKELAGSLSKMAIEWLQEAHRQF